MRPRRLRSIRTSLLTAASAVVVFVLNAAAAHAGGQPPIHLVFDMHADPIPQVPYAQKADYYSMQLENGNWVLDQTEPLGVPISFLASGEFAEFVVQGGPAGPGADFLRRIHAAGEQIGSHSHREYRRSAFDWPSYPDTAGYAESMQSWQDDIDWVNAAIETALGSPPPKPLDEINAVKGAHLPTDESEYHDLMREFGIEVRQGGAEEDYYGIYGHHIMNPFRPSVDNYMGEDLSSPFVVVPQGAVIGKATQHHGIWQDMTAPGVKRLFIQTYLNWRYRDRHGLGEKVWCFGWGSHNKDYDPGSDSRADMVEMIHWLDDNFVGRADATGSVIARWSTQAGTAADYFAWEAAHPGESSFDSNGSHLDWDDYPYLRAVCTELRGARHVADLDLGPGVTAWRLARGPESIVVAFRDAGPAAIDLSMLVGTPCRVVGAETGLLLGTEPGAVVVGPEPVIVTEAAPTIEMSGSPVIGGTVTLTVQGRPGEQASVYLSQAPDSVDVPYLGRILIDRDAGLLLLGGGPLSDGRFALEVAIPDNPALVGRTFHIQGLEMRDDGMTLTVNALAVTISGGVGPEPHRP
jgi:hypothetical protein